jgi:hypothetical protein
MAVLATRAANLEKPPAEMVSASGSISVDQDINHSMIASL